MKLSKAERLILANQFQLLSTQENNYMSQETCKNNVTILLKGYELLYDDIFSRMNEEVNSEQCRFVLDVLSMYRTISNSYSDLSEKDSTLTKRDIAFGGFDGNNEKEYSFAKFFIQDYDRFRDLEENEFMKFNSHSPSIAKYENELNAYNEIINSKKQSSRFKLTEDEINVILNS